jgi:predicted  nucleic acid-binding Zn-ribbon protein
MMSDKLARFPNLSIALFYLKRTAPASATEAWSRLGEVTLLHDGENGSVGLSLPRKMLPASDPERKLKKQFHATLLDGDRQTNWKATTPGQEIFRRVLLRQSHRPEECRRCLVIPQTCPAKTMTELIAELSELDGWTVWLRGCKSVGTIYELRSLDDEPLPPPAGLPGAPFVLVGISDDIFIPPGFEQPLLPAYRLLIPPQRPDRLHVWIPASDRHASYQRLEDSGEKADPLLRLVLADSAEGRVLTAASAGEQQRISVPLKLLPTHSHRQLNRARQVIYRIETRSGQFGPSLLRILDHVEAGIEDFTYFSRSLGEGPNATIEHFLQTDSQLVDEQGWSDVRRYDWPDALHAMGIPLFVPAKSDFLPNIEGMLTAVDSDDPFVEQLRQRTQLDRASIGRVALAVPEGDSGEWSVLHLEQGRPLKDCINVVLSEFNREAIRQVVDIARVDLQEDRREYEEQWAAAGELETQELMQLTDSLISELERTAADIDSELAQITNRLEGAREVATEILAALDSMPETVTGFAERMVELIEFVSEPRRAWLIGAEVRQQAMERLTRGIADLQEDLQTRVEAIVSEAETQCDQLIDAQASLRAASERMDTSADGLPAQVEQVEQAITEAEAALQQRDQYLQDTQNRVQSAERELEQQRQQLEQKESQIRVRETQLTQTRTQLRQRETQLEKREAELQREQERLIAMEQQLVNRAESLDERRNNLNDQLQQLESRGNELKRLEAVELAALQRAIQERRADVDELQETIVQKFERMRIATSSRGIFGAIWKSLLGR